MVARAAAYVWNWWFLNRIRGQMDFVGLNYYFTTYYSWHLQTKNPSQPLNDLGWYMEPNGIERLLKSVWERYRLPSLITENGLADTRDTQRQWWLEQTMIALERTQASGVPLLGYLHWSLLDNFEWAYGWWPKFGLVKVDRTTMHRAIRPSARWFADQIKQFKR
jgi:beta-glucosidase